MNIFYLHPDPTIAAQMMCDKHVLKMVLETAQLLSTAHRELDGDEKAAAEMRSCRAPGQARLMPAWEVTRARDASKQAYLQERRVRGAGRGGGGDDSGDEPRRRRRGRGRAAGEAAVDPKRAAGGRGPG